MALKNIVALQKRFDTAHGWSTDSGGDPRFLLASLTRDLVGLFGEVGEFANIVKKLALVAERFDDRALKKALDLRRNALSEEITDVLIYTVRLASMLDVDLTRAHRDKVKKNARRFRKYERRRAT